MIQIPTSKIGTNSRLPPIHNTTGRPSAIAGNYANGRAVRPPLGKSGAANIGSNARTVASTRSAMLDRTNGQANLSDNATSEKVTIY